jgi:hypothetical protein
MLTGVLTATLLAIASAGGSAGAADDDATLVQRYAADSIVLDELIIGYPLNAADRRYVVKDAARNVRSSRDFAVRADAYARETLADAKRYPGRVGGMRESLRFLAATEPADNIWGRFIVAHDPPIAFDRTNRRLVTEASLVALQRACTFLTRFVHEPGPDAGFIARARSYLRGHFSRLPPNQQEAIAHVGRDLPIIRYDTEHAKAAQTAAFVKAAQPLFTRQELLAPNTIAVLAPFDQNIAMHDALIHQIVMHSLMLNGQAFTNMQLHRSWQMFGTP